MKKIERYLEKIYTDRICEQFDHVMPIIGDEGMGKSTLILECAIMWQDIKEEERKPDSILDSLVYTRDGMKDALAESERRSVIAVPDAARVLHKKEAMRSEQVEIEKDFFDVRTKEFLILLGFQDWNSVPRFLQERRAKSAIYIPRRGVVRGYNRSSLDDRVESDTWPRSDLTDTFPSLEGTDIWDAYRDLDRKKKDERINGSDDDHTESEDPDLFDIAEQIKSDGIDSVVSIHAGNKSRYIDSDLIELRYDLNSQESRKVKKLLATDSEVSLDQKAKA